MVIDELYIKGFTEIFGPKQSSGLKTKLEAYAFPVRRELLVHGSLNHGRRYNYLNKSSRQASCLVETLGLRFNDGGRWSSLKATLIGFCCSSTLVKLLKHNMPLTPWILRLLSSHFVFNTHCILSKFISDIAFLCVWNTRCCFFCFPFQFSLIRRWLSYSLSN